MQLKKKKTTQVNHSDKISMWMEVYIQFIFLLKCVYAPFLEGKWVNVLGCTCNNGPIEAHRPHKFVTTLGRHD